jgi:hypothetical protein
MKFYRPRSGVHWLRRKRLGRAFLAIKGHRGIWIEAFCRLAGGHTVVAGNEWQRNAVRHLGHPKAVISRMLVAAFFVWAALRQNRLPRSVIINARPRINLREAIETIKAPATYAGPCLHGRIRHPAFGAGKMYRDLAEAGHGRLAVPSEESWTQVQPVTHQNQRHQQTSAAKQCDLHESFNL